MHDMHTIPFLIQEGVEYYFSVLAENSDGQSEPLITEKRIRPMKPPGVLLPGHPTKLIKSIMTLLCAKSFIESWWMNLYKLQWHSPVRHC